jgi:hypothetical protein
MYMISNDQKNIIQKRIKDLPQNIQEYVRADADTQFDILEYSLDAEDIGIKVSCELVTTKPNDQPTFDHIILNNIYIEETEFVAFEKKCLECEVPYQNMLHILISRFNRETL